MPLQDNNPHRTDIGGKFRIGETILSPGVRAIVDADPIAAVSLNAFVRLHQNGNWGTVSSEQVSENERALQDGGPVRSIYALQSQTIWIVTDAEPRDTTRVLLPEESVERGLTS
jgi:hypothetical protein